MAGENERDLARIVVDAVYNLGGAMSGKVWREEELLKNGIDQAALARIDALYQEFRGRVGALTLARLNINVRAEHPPIPLDNPETAEQKEQRIQDWLENAPF